MKGITAVYEATTEYERLVKLLTEYKQSQRAKLREEADKFLETANDWKDKKAGILYSRETMERNILDIVKDKKLAQEIIAEYFTPVHEAQAKSTRLKNKMRERVQALNLSTKETKAHAEGGEKSLKRTPCSCWAKRWTTSGCWRTAEGAWRSGTARR